MKKMLRLKRSQKQDITSRITNETVAEHRERILAGGRKFKYPLQYARHKLVINAIIIGVITLVAFIIFTWWQLYQVQNPSNFFYRLTRVVPVPVASVDGEMVPYGNFLMYYRSSEHYLEQYDQIKNDSPDGKRQLAYMKRRTLDNVERDAYVQKLANGLHTKVTDAEVDKIIERDRNVQNGKISQEIYDASAMSVLNWTRDEYRQDVKSRLLMQKVSYLVDDAASKKQRQAKDMVAQPNANFAEIAKQLTDATSKVEASNSGMINISQAMGGLGYQAAKLEKGQISDVLKSDTGDGYYILKLIDKNETQVNYDFIKVPLTTLKKNFQKLKDAGKIKEYIKVPEASAA